VRNYIDAAKRLQNAAIAEFSAIHRSARDARAEFERLRGERSASVTGVVSPAVGHPKHLHPVAEPHTTERPRRRGTRLRGRAYRPRRLPLAASAHGGGRRHL
jgi:hypothetical protein